jgi:hypothetical protein
MKGLVPPALVSGRKVVYPTETTPGMALQHLIHRREIVVVRKGWRVHLDRSDLDRWIESNKE